MNGTRSATPTRKQQQALEAVIDFMIRTGLSPKLRQVAKSIKRGDIATLTRLRGLRTKGYVTWQEKEHGTLRVTPLGLGGTVVRRKGKVVLLLHGIVVALTDRQAKALADRLLVAVNGEEEQ